jgi:hypothetical protein
MALSVTGFFSSLLGLTLAPFVSSLVIAIAFASVQQKHQGLLSSSPDYSALNAQEINHQTFAAAAEMNSK